MSDELKEIRELVETFSRGTSGRIILEKHEEEHLRMLLSHLETREAEEILHKADEVYRPVDGTREGEVSKDARECFNCRFKTEIITDDGWFCGRPRSIPCGTSIEAWLPRGDGVERYVQSRISAEPKTVPMAMLNALGQWIIGGSRKAREILASYGYEVPE